LSASSAYNYERKLASVTKKYTEQARMRQRRERKRRETLQNASDFLTYGTDSNNNSRINKRKKLMRRCALEWEFLANVIDRILLFVFSVITIMFFLLLGFFDTLITIE
jgi:ABC-type multidrug transport system fused ATPase/permease subunit